MHPVPGFAKQHIAIVLVPGSFSSPTEAYTYVSQKLAKNGYISVYECPLQTASSKDKQRTPPPKLADDVHHIREVLEGLLSDGKDVVMVMNSYGGIPRPSKS